MSDAPTNEIDLAFMAEQQRLEVEIMPVRREFDILGRMIGESQTPGEFGFGFSLGHDELVLARGAFLVKAKPTEKGIDVWVRKRDGSNYEQSMLAALAHETTADAKAAAGMIGSFMARIVEDRLF